MTTFDQKIQNAIQKHQQGEIQQAYDIYRALFQSVQNDQLRYLLGLAALQLNQPENALDWLKPFKSARSVPLEYALTLASAEAQCGQIDVALARLNALSERHPKVPAIWNNLGNLYQNINAWHDAIRCYERALTLKKNHLSARFNLALCLQKLGRAHDACATLKPIIEHGAADEHTWGLWIQILRQLHQHSAAQTALDIALRRHPHSAQLWLQQGALYEQQKHWTSALTAYENAAKRQPELSLAWSQLAYMQATNGEWEALRKTRDIIEQHIRNGSSEISPFVLLALTDDPQLQYQAACQWSQRYRPWVETRPHAEKRDRLTIAYLSADFYQHPTAWLAANLFEQHDRSRFRILAYSNSPNDKSAMRKRLEQAFDAFYDIRHWSVPDIVQHIKAQNVDILIDLKGHTEDNLLEVLAQRPAPLQLTYLGYPGTTGAPFIDGVIVDKIVLPEPLTRHFSEQPIYLDGCYQVNDIKRPRPEPSKERAIFGFRAQDIVLACFNNSWKITQSMLECWLSILMTTSNTYLWLMDRNPKSRFRENVIRFVKQKGLAEDRVRFATPKPYSAYLEYYGRVDLMLDTYPYNAHTMTSDALWMACPVLTLEGQTFAARVASSLIRHHTPELSEALICRSYHDYVQQATTLISTPQTLRKIRQQLEARVAHSPIFDSRRFARDFEEKVLKLWQQHINIDTTHT